MWARIENGTVAELTDIDPAGRFHPSMIWMACSKSVRPGWMLVNGKLQPPGELLPQLHERKLQEIDRACEAVIIAGFSSSALGTPHAYSSEIHDQLNLTGAVQTGLDLPHPCRNEDGTREFLMHTSAQLQEVGRDLAVYKVKLLEYAHLLKHKLDLALAAEDQATMEAVVWGEQP
jgi:hypothetical protein